MHPLLPRGDWPHLYRGGTSDLFCTRKLYRDWCWVLLNVRFPHPLHPDPHAEDAVVQPPIWCRNAVESTRVELWNEAGESTPKFLKIWCQDVLNPYDRAVVSNRQMKKSAEQMLNPPVDGPGWRWLQEDNEQGYWIMECGWDEEARVDERTNSLGNTDTHGWCIDPEKEKPMWWEKVPAFRFSNKNVLWETGKQGSKTQKKDDNDSDGEGEGEGEVESTWEPPIANTKCYDVKPFVEEDRYLKIKGTVMFGLALSCHLLYSAGKKCVMSAPASLFIF